jgi:hypothetical protein
MGPSRAAIAARSLRQWPSLYPVSALSRGAFSGIPLAWYSQ